MHPISVLLASGEDRVRNLLPVKYGRMKQSPFAFFRGAVPIMAADLARLPNSGLHVQLCGDAHLQNLGSFAAPDGKLVFDLHDFDEDDSRAMGAAEVCLESYCRSIQQFSREPVLQVARHLFDLFRTVDVGFKVVGTGSVELRNYVVLFEGTRGGGLNTLAVVAGELLARGRARSCEACQISGYCGGGVKIRNFGRFRRRIRRPDGSRLPGVCSRHPARRNQS